ncbi:glycoside hydrolase domain-containing protein [Metabacillus arenae]|uniref:DUF1906 domain-containing protein n=1 Tax=Metabacillus arenae TaxID=2771434 RepID=A0A926S1R6_9BACI|nr:glycoside hydrolase domain-containing protein [Metabacillus arenae]MBD1381259.1 DUF1906 domain-containing protein [Metabacillus arenae]
MARKIWGVDSASKVDQDLYACVKKKFGTPKFWGRYLTDVGGVSKGLTKFELSFIRSKGIKLLPIYNGFNIAEGYEQGKLAVRNATFHAKKIGVPKETVLFANVERFIKTNEEWIKGWVETMYQTGYRPGFYHDPHEGDFSFAYCQAVAENHEIANQTILWSSEPNPGPTSERKAPKYNPATMRCRGNVWVWQYGRDAADCSINTNLADERLVKYLY